jgi:hypothetical protein
LLPPPEVEAPKPWWEDPTLTELTDIDRTYDPPEREPEEVIEPVEDAPTFDPSWADDSALPPPAQPSALPGAAGGPFSFLNILASSAHLGGGPTILNLPGRVRTVIPGFLGVESFTTAARGEADYGDIVDVRLISKHAVKDETPEFVAIPPSFGEAQVGAYYGGEGFVVSHLGPPRVVQMSHPLERRARPQQKRVEPVGCPEEW